MGVLVGAALVAILGLLAQRGRRAASDRPLEAPAADRAYQRGLAAVRDGHYLESLPDFRAAAEARPDQWNMHHDYAAALLNAVHQGRSHLGHSGFVLRSSFERVRFVHEGLARLDAAEALARDPRHRAMVHLTRAQILKAWGLPWNAFVDYRASQWADTSSRRAARVAVTFMDLMKNPTQPGD